MRKTARENKWPPNNFEWQMIFRPSTRLVSAHSFPARKPPKLLNAEYAHTTPHSHTHYVMWAGKTPGWAPPSCRWRREYCCNLNYMGNFIDRNSFFVYGKISVQQECGVFFFRKIMNFVNIYIPNDIYFTTLFIIYKKIHLIQLTQFSTN